MKFVHNPVIVQAMQVPPRGAPELAAFMGWLVGRAWKMDETGNFFFPTDNGEWEVPPGDWVVKDGTGALHFCDDAAFRESYSAVK